MSPGFRFFLHTKKNVHENQSKDEQNSNEFAHGFLGGFDKKNKRNNISSICNARQLHIVRIQSKKMVKMAFQNEKKTLNLKKEKKSEVGSTADHHLCVCLSAAHKNRLQCET